MAVRPRSIIYVVFVLGTILFLNGLGVAFVNRNPALLEKTLIGLGLLGIIFPIIKIKYLHHNHLIQIKKRVFVVVGFLFILMLYFEVNYLGFIHNRRIDFTKFKQHTLLPQTIKQFESLQQNIKMTAFYVGIPPKYLEDLFREYQRLSNGRISAEIIDPLVRIGYAAQFGHVIDGKERKVFIQSVTERKDIDFTDKPLTQESINNAVMQLTRKARTACFLTGHGESRLFDDKPEGLNKFSRHLLANNILGKEIAIEMVGEIPEACNMLVVAGPKSHLTVKEEGIIQTYLEKGGDALLLIENIFVSSPQMPLTQEQQELNPSLNNILRDWGVAVSKDVVVDLDSHASGDVGSPATRNYMFHRAIVNGLDYTFFIRPRSIKMLRDRKESIKLAPLILTSSDKNSWGETNRYLNVKFDPEEDRAGPVPIAFAIMEPKEKDKLSDTRIIVITDADFISNAYIESYSNAQLGVNAVSWLTELDYVAYLDQTQVKITKLDLTSKQKRAVAYLLFLEPSLLISLGLLVWMKQSE